MFASEPEKDDAMSLVLRAWTDLESTRSVGMAIGPIPWTAQLEWCRFNGLGHHETVIVLSVLRRLEVDRVERESKK